MVRRRFGDIDVSYKEADVVFLPVPYEGTVTYGEGTGKGPAAIIDASVNAEWYDPATNRDFSKFKITTLAPIRFAKSTPAKAVKKVEECVASIVNDGKKPFLLGGEHSITPAAVRAVAARHEVGVVQIDAHADLRKEYGGSRLSHACVMSRVRESAPAVQLGVRSCSMEEAREIKRRKYIVLDVKSTLHRDNLRRALDSLPESIYLTIDVDGLDPSIMPATGTPEPGGFGWDEINRIVRTVCEHKKLAGADIVELAPIKGMHAPDFLCAKLAFNILAEFFK